MQQTAKVAERNSFVERVISLDPVQKLPKVKADYLADLVKLFPVIDIEFIRNIKSQCIDYHIYFIFF